MPRSIPRRSRRVLCQGLDQLETRQLLSASSLPVHGPVVHHPHRPHPIAMVERIHLKSPGVIPLAAPQPGNGPAASIPGFNIVPSPVITRSSLDAIARITDNDIWAVGNTSPFSGGDTTLAEHFNGTSWTVVATPNPGPFGSVLSGVAAAATNNVWAVGSGGSLNSSGAFIPTTLIEHYNGTAWSVVASPTPTGGGVLSAVTVISANNVWAVGHVGEGRGGNLIEHYNGTAWSIVASPQGADSFLTGVSGTSATDVWAVGSVGRFDSVEILHFNGTAWSVAPGVPEDSALEGVVALAPNDVWAVGADIEHFNGTTWSVVPSPGDFGLTGIAASSADNIYAVGGGIEHWDGTSWTNVTTAVPSNTDGALFDGVTTLSNGTAIAVGSAQPLTGPNNFNQVIEQN